MINNNKIEFEKEMLKLEKVLELKGYVLERDHAYAYNMQYYEDYEVVKDWLENRGYKGKLESAGGHNEVAVYGLYDSNRITYQEMQKKLLDEARSDY